MTEDDFSALVVRARRFVAAPEQRESVRAVKRERRAALDDYVAAMRAMRRRDEAAVKRYQATITAEAAALRTEVRELRELLAALVGA